MASVPVKITLTAQVGDGLPVVLGDGVVQAFLEPAGTEDRGVQLLFDQTRFLDDVANAIRTVAILPVEDEAIRAVQAPGSPPDPVS